MAKSGSIRERLEELIRRTLSIKAPIMDATRIYHDLFISGDDAVDLINQIHNAFGTRFDKFVFADYFPDETESLWAYWGSRLGFKSKKREITFRHLLDVVENGAWFDPK